MSCTHLQLFIAGWLHCAASQLHSSATLHLLPPLHCLSPPAAPYCSHYRLLPAFTATPRLHSPATFHFCLPTLLLSSCTHLQLSICCCLLCAAVNQSSLEIPPPCCCQLPQAPPPARNQNQSPLGISPICAAAATTSCSCQSKRYSPQLHSQTRAQLHFEHNYTLGGNFMNYFLRCWNATPMS